MKMVKNLIILTVIWLIAISAHAELYMELTQGLNHAIPIAISPLRGPVVNGAGDQTVDEIVRNDLRNSGQFTLAAPENADYVLQGSITPASENNYTVTAQLQSAFTPAGGQPLVLFKKVFQVKTADLRALGHTISDLVYEQLTGVRGIFSTKIAYIVRRWPTYAAPIYTLEVADADGFNPLTLLESPQPIMSPSWAPNGRDIAYVSFENHHASIYKQNTRTGQRQLVSSFNGINGAPAFSPDGSRLAVVLTKTDNPKIYVLDLATSHWQQITDGYSIDTEPRWSPDGKSLLFTSDRGGSPQIYRYDLRSAQVTRLTYQGDYNARASIFPDGRSIILMHRANGEFGIAKQDLASGQLQILTESGVDESPSLAPNGKMVLYATRYQGRGILAVVSTDGRVKLRLPARAGSVQEPAWSPFST